MKQNVYKIDLWLKDSWYECSWGWSVKNDGETLATGETETRWGANRAARRAARRHKRTGSAVKTKKNTINTYYYHL